jgi:transketolase
MVTRAIKIAYEFEKKGVSLAVVNMSCVRALDDEGLGQLVKLPFICTYEDHNINTGIGPFIAQQLLTRRYKGRMESFGVKGYGPSGETDEIMAAEGLDVDSMVKALSKMLKRKRRSKG